MIYETKGLSLEQVDELYGVVSQAWKSKQFHPKVQFSEMDHIGPDGRKLSLADVGNNQERKRSIHDEPQITEKV
jgi:SP family sugar:H+ symporter-like MFS transporter